MFVCLRFLKRFKGFAHWPRIVCLTIFFKISFFVLCIRNLYIHRFETTEGLVNDDSILILRIVIPLSVHKIRCII